MKETTGTKNRYRAIFLCKKNHQIVVPTTCRGASEYSLSHTLKKRARKVIVSEVKRGDLKRDVKMAKCGGK
jgi:hypothetical protein